MPDTTWTKEVLLYRRGSLVSCTEEWRDCYEKPDPIGKARRRDRQIGKRNRVYKKISGDLQDGSSSPLSLKISTKKPEQPEKIIVNKINQRLWGHLRKWLL